MSYFQDFPQSHIFNIMSGLAEKNVPSPNYIKLFLMLNISHLVYSHYFKFSLILSRVTSVTWKYEKWLCLFWQISVCFSRNKISNQPIFLKIVSGQLSWRQFSHHPQTLNFKIINLLFLVCGKRGLLYKTEFV